MASDNNGDVTHSNTSSEPAMPATRANAGNEPAVPGAPSTRFYSRSTQHKGQYGRHWDSEKQPETFNSPGMLNTFAVTRPPASSLPNPAAPPFTPAPRGWAPTPNTAGRAPDSSVGVETERDNKRKGRKYKFKKERNNVTTANTPVSDTPGGLRDTTNRRPQRRNFPGPRNPGMRRRDEVDGNSAVPRAGRDEPKAVETPQTGRSPATTAKEDIAVNEQSVDAEEITALPLYKEKDVEAVETSQDSDGPAPRDIEVSPPKEAEDPSKPSSEPAEEEAEAAPPLTKWSPIFPPGGPRPTPAPKPTGDGAANGLPKRTNYIDKRGNYHAPNGTIMSPELLKMFSAGKIRNSLGDTVYFMPSFIAKYPPVGQQPYRLASTPSRIFYDPRDLKISE
ncbi:hypothetical protein MGYG_00900 [Nannizzia gypsea CBS 118893]|uniref:Uncharacterized protein n=1 Tax=Arthroderma gypseum (strain ATCC MYA-4604 / CBS 118893) TaxID=535722 RepID=E5R2I5_ARTGP|nr:hypothetical protein MGYG_00900 [Nannizzia gypsea CBS 118893]EFQ97861.1 hypothetical protein MGYG_00900 [Nannizzia gypsea CBS 118893]